MLFGKKQRQDKTECSAPYLNFVTKKVAGGLSHQRDLIISSAQKLFPRGAFEATVKRDLIVYGHATSQVVAVGLAAIIKKARRRELADIEYGDCALAASFLMRLPLRGHDEAIDEVIRDWIEAFETDLRYLIFAEELSVSDLIEVGNDRFVHYETNSDTKLPVAYFHLLSRVITLREQGEPEPYRLLNASLASSPILLASLEDSWIDLSSLIQHWMDTVVTVQMEAEEHGQEVWNWY
ncbi:MAG: hypothetical protein ABJH63_10240 [Rhizobiaceae bacterium]